MAAALPGSPNLACRRRRGAAAAAAAAATDGGLSRRDLSSPKSRNYLRRAADITRWRASEKASGGSGRLSSGRRAKQRYGGTYLKLCKERKKKVTIGAAAVFTLSPSVCEQLQSVFIPSMRLLSAVCGHLMT